MTDHPNEVVRLDLPAVPRHVATARAVAASLAAGAGWTIDDIDDVRLALDELLALLVDAAGAGERVQLTLGVDDAGAIEVHGSLAEGAGRVTTLDELSQRIVDAIADDYEVSAGTFRLTKRPAGR